MIKKSQIYFVDEVFDQEKKEEDNNMHIPSQTPPKTPKGSSSAERNDKITIDVEAKGLEELTEQAEELRDAISTAPRVLIKNPRDCTITVDGSEYRSEFWSRQEAEQPEPDRTRVEREDKDLGEISHILFNLQEACRRMGRCEACPLEMICDEGGSRFTPCAWKFGK